MTDVLALTNVTKRYGRTRALHDCTLTLPAGHIVALVGPNGAGKSTLLHLIAGLLAPTSGDLAVFGHSPLREQHALLPRIGFVAQDHALYRGFTVAEMLHTSRILNRHWDQVFARERLTSLEIPLDRRMSDLSGGQQAQVALVLALAKQPELLLLDEPLASLDPLARRTFLQVMLDVAVTHHMTILLSSHIISDLERVCDYLILLMRGSVHLTGNIDTILAEHNHLTSSSQDLSSLASRHTIIEATQTPRQTSALVRLNGPLFGPAWESTPASLEDIVLAYLRRSAKSSDEFSPVPVEVQP